MSTNTDLRPTDTPILELYQAEWCPYSARVRQRLTQLGLDYITRQVDVARDWRHALVARPCQAMIPVLIDRKAVATGNETIVAYLDSTHPESTHAMSIASAQRTSAVPSSARHGQKLSTTTASPTAPAVCRPQRGPDSMSRRWRRRRRSCTRNGGRRRRTPTPRMSSLLISSQRQLTGAADFGHASSVDPR